jgi:hypothetical protein
METRNKYTKVQCELGLTIDGRELPSMAIVGEALEKAIELIEAAVAESYKVVPPRAVDAPTAPTEQPVAQRMAVNMDLPGAALTTVPAQVVPIVPVQPVEPEPAQPVNPVPSPSVWGD